MLRHIYRWVNTKPIYPDEFMIHPHGSSAKYTQVGIYVATYSGRLPLNPPSWVSLQDNHHGFMLYGQYGLIIPLYPIPMWF